jgi:hypothetical protein
MYGINLIRQRIVPEHRKHLVFSVISLSVLAYILTALGVVIFSAANFRVIDAYANEIEKLELGLATIYPGTPSQDELETIVHRVRPDLDEIGKLVDKRTGTTYIWEGITAAVPDSVWLTRILIKTQALPNGKKGRPKNMAGGLVFEGVAIYDDGGGSNLIRRFAENLEHLEVLAGKISGSKYVETGKRTVGRTEVIGFEITCPFTAVE